MIENYKKFCEDTILHILKRPLMYGDGIRLESCLLGTIVFAGLLKQIPIIKVIDLWKDYRHRLFAPDCFLLSEFPPDYVIQLYDKDDSEICLIFDEVFAGLSMYYTKAKLLASLKNNNLSLKQQENVVLNFAESEILLAIRGDYNRYFLRWTRFYVREMLLHCRGLWVEYKPPMGGF